MLVAGCCGIHLRPDRFYFPTVVEMTSYHFQAAELDLVERGGDLPGAGAPSRLEAHRANAADRMNTLKRKGSFQKAADHTHRLTRKTSSRLGLVRKNSIGFHNEGTLCEHIITCRMDLFDCCIVGLCYFVIGMVGGGALLVLLPATGSVTGEDAESMRDAGYAMLGIMACLCTFMCVLNHRGGWKS